MSYAYGSAKQERIDIFELVLVTIWDCIRLYALDITTDPKLVMCMLYRNLADRIYDWRPRTYKTKTGFARRSYVELIDNIVKANPALVEHFSVLSLSHIVKLSNIEQIALTDYATGILQSTTAVTQHCTRACISAAFIRAVIKLRDHAVEVQGVLI